jgi:5-hydroxyisourate hydrolase-like protein (transthyretin family)
MSFSARYLLTIVIAISSLPASLFAQSTPKQTTKTARGSISGRVTIKEKGAAGVVVVLRKTEGAMPFEPVQHATTDQDGYYRVSNVPAGSYDVSPGAPAYVAADVKVGKNKIVLVGEDENVEDIDFSLVRGGVITGRVTDADGRPVIQQEVNIYFSNAFDQVTPQRPAPRVSLTTTDDRGIYRIYGLAAGKYKVAAGRSDDAFSTSFATTRFSYRRVFHPDVTDPAKATIIEVTEGSETANVDIALARPLQTFTVSGRVVDGEKGLPAPGLRFGIQRNVDQRFEFMNTLATSNTQGEFILEGLIPGKYSIFLLPNQNNETRAEPLTFDVIDQDVSGVVVRLTKGASVSGVVAFESDDKTMFAKLSELQLRGYVANPSGGIAMGASASSPIGADGSFRFGGLPGGTLSFNLGSLNSPYPPKGVNIVRLERDGVIAARGIEIKDGEQLTGIRVVLALGNATLRGLVKIENGSLPEGARIFIRVSKPGEPNSSVRPSQVDARGHFLIEGLPAGAYDIIASILGTVPMPPRTVKREVAVADNMVTDVTLTIDMSAPPTKPQP